MQRIAACLGSAPAVAVALAMLPENRFFEYCGVRRRAARLLPTLQARPKTPEDRRTPRRSATTWTDVPQGQWNCLTPASMIL